MNLLKQLSIFSIILLVASQGAVAMQKKAGKTPAASSSASTKENKTKKNVSFDDEESSSSSSDESDAKVAATESAAEESGSWFTPGKMAAGAGTLAASALAFRSLSPEARARALHFFAKTPVVAAAGLLTGGFLMRAIANWWQGTEVHDGLDLTDDEKALLAEDENGEAVERPVWQMKLFALLRVLYPKQKPEDLKTQVLRVSDPYALLATKFLDKVEEGEYFVGLLSVLKAYTAWFNAVKKAELEEMLTENQAEAKAALADVELKNLLTEKYKLTLAQQKFVRGVLKVLEVYAHQQNELAQAITEAKK